MKALFLRTHTPDCEKFWLSWEAAGHPCEVVQYDDRPHDRQNEIIEVAERAEPDLIVYIGAIEKFHLRPVLTVDTLTRLRAICPSIHICGDGSDEPWWEWLELYRAEDCFDLQVSIDGNFDTPLVDYGFITLTPTDPRSFSPLPWAERTRPAGMPGGMGHGERAELLSYMYSVHQFSWRGAYGSYRDMCDFMCSCKLIVNVPRNGTGDKDHVKGRVLETGWAGACLLERKNDVTSRWFTPGEDYIEYKNAADAARLITSLDYEHARSVAESLHERVVREYSPNAWWDRILEKLSDRRVAA